MGIRREISAEVAKLEKYAQSVWGDSRSLVFGTDPQGYQSSLAADAHLARGGLKAVGNTVPEMVDVAVGLPYALGGGLAHGWEGFKQNRRDFNDYVTEPIRQFERNYLGGNYIADASRKVVDRMDEAAGIPAGYGNGLEDLAEGIGTLAATWPMFAKPMGAVSKGLGYVQEAVSKVPVIGKTVSKAVTPVGWGTYVGADMDAPGMIHDGWQWAKYKMNGNKIDLTDEQRDDMHTQIKNFINYPIDRNNKEIYEKAKKFYHDAKEYYKDITPEDWEALDQKAHSLGLTPSIVVK